MQGDLETKNIGLGGLAPYFGGVREEQKNAVLYDATGNAYTFFKYKARLIDLAQMAIQVKTNYKSRQEVMEEIRKNLSYGINVGDVIVLHMGQNSNNWDEFFKGEQFWEPKQLFAPYGKFDSKWYLSKVVKPADKDAYGQTGNHSPNENFLIILSFTQDLSVADLPCLKECREYFFKLSIQ